VLKIVSKGSFNINWFEVNEKTLGMNQIMNTNEFILYPNPSKGSVSIKINDEGYAPQKIVVVNQLGETIIDSEFYHEREFQINRLKSGMYIVILYDRSNTPLVKKLIVE